MEPRSIERGNFTWLPTKTPNQPASMEPRSIERGNIRCDAIATDHERASMEPRSIERGNLTQGRQRLCRRTVLQWSHARLSVETPRSRSGSEAHAWLQWSHARLSVET